MKDDAKGLVVSWTCFVGPKPLNLDICGFMWIFLRGISCTGHFPPGSTGYFIPLRRPRAELWSLALHLRLI